MKISKKNILMLSAVLIILAVSIREIRQEAKRQGLIIEQEGIKLVSKIEGRSIMTAGDGEWKNTFLRGVNMGTAKPGYYPGEFGITKEDYLRWFKQIAEMNANVIRVYTLQMPCFYEALYEYNEKAETPLYILQGVWLDEEMMQEEMDAFSSQVTTAFMGELRSIIDVIHGNKEILQTRGKAYGNYKKDISSYVLGYIMGTEWNPYFVRETNEKNTGLNDFEGEFVETEDAAPMEIWLAGILEEGISYETANYDMQKPMAITNWLTTDSLVHDYDVEEANRIGNIDEEHIKSKEAYQAGLFVSYHVYPYYPDFLNYESPYIEADENNEINSYKAYLEDLIEHHSKPVLVSEFGIPTSRGISHRSSYSGFNQGMVDEADQGEMLRSMIQDIYQSGSAGAVIFSWQDEWFKKTWNTMAFDDGEGRAYWFDKLTNEQCFGLLSFDPGEEEKVTIDGDLREWKNSDLISQNEDMKLYMTGDEAYLYLGVQYQKLNLNEEKLWIPLQVTALSGSHGYEGTSIKFDEPVDFIIQIEGENTAQVVVQDYYDATKFYEENYRSSDVRSTHFDIVTQVIARGAVLPLSGNQTPYEKVEIGRLNTGSSNPLDETYRSLTDFNVSSQGVEIRIPWLMLNISNPAKKLALGDFQKDGEFRLQHIDGIKASVYRIGLNQNSQLPFGKYEWKAWDMPSYHERLKPAYSVVKEQFRQLREADIRRE